MIDENSLIGATIHGYYLEEILGAGGMGVVYKARSLSSRYVALKILMPIEKEPLSPAAYEKFLHRFKREATVIATLNHPNIVRVYEYGEYLYADDMSLPYTVMPLLCFSGKQEKLTED